MQTIYNPAFLILGLLFFSLKSCSSSEAVAENEVETETSYYSNIIVLLDLSDRTNETQVTRDTLLIREIVQSFSRQVKEHRYMYAKDRLQLKIVPQEGNKSQVYNPTICIDEHREHDFRIRDSMPSYCNSFMNDVARIYAMHQKFSGADIWSYFRDFLGNDLLDSETRQDKQGNVYMYKNKVILITDGYLNFEKEIEQARPEGTYMQVGRLLSGKNWQKDFERWRMKPTGNKFSPADVLILEVNPKNQVNDTEIIRAYWKDWINHMPRLKLHGTHLVSESITDIHRIIETFINDSQQ